ncbi:ABC transporter ATP-binding protein [Arthrobacter sp. zg-Y20]|uniref:ABC transporter ATP-binding protein n=1 Tax=unclassified Arthrobacter TaxID=235627 RepID=UPI001D15743E|nr:MULTISPECIES: ABC transporter ATP-binding protein [unclassified Arthrobacter]MCC3277388.1 ABC transporter ATP-binding protein [Arthrobacter sp. zg-Y20]MDK1317548.1 ABC transporter ATP-binding protein [Arthrobacter sp. zg.Y20]WIB06955.1 ABC transporter ATP-binding protein [Arthrobacter sp. zg-Y20]
MTADGRLIDAEGLRKSFGRFPALRGVDLQVRQGEVHGFLGPNGSGKSTTIRVLLGLLKADAGTVRLLGGNPWTDVVPLHRRLAYVPGDVSLWPGMSGGEAIDLLGSLRGGLDPRRRAELLERFELDSAKRGRQYSKGNRQKVALVAALAADVELLILDEPTSGLDPLMENVFQNEIVKARQRGTTVLLSSHVLAEVENLADRLSIIREGAIVRAGTLPELRGTARSTVRATLEYAAGAADVRGLHDLHLDGPRLTATVAGPDLDQAMTGLAKLGMTSLSVEPPSLETLFLSLYEDGNEAA